MKKLSLIAAALALFGTGAFAANQNGSASCCAINAACCTPVSACCDADAKSKAAQEKQNQADSCCTPSACCAPAASCCK